MVEIVQANLLTHFVAETNLKRLRIISPFISNNIVTEILNRYPGIKLEVITRFNLNDFKARVSDINALDKLLEGGHLVKGIKALHSKAYIFDSQKAIITSANFTNGGFFTNCELGIIAYKKELIEECNAYFNKLWSISDETLNLETLNKWKKQLDKQPKQEKTNLLPDYGNSLFESPTHQAYFIKIFGESKNRALLTEHVRDIVEISHCHYAVCFSKGKGKPWRYSDGDRVYMAHITEDHGYAIFGRGIAYAFKEDRDQASVEEKKLLNWKNKWPVYIRVRDCEFLNTDLKNCISTHQLLDELSYESFETTLRHFNNGYPSETINPKRSFGRQADVRLSHIGAGWMDNSFNEKKKKFGLIPRSFISKLHQGSEVNL